MNVQPVDRVHSDALVFFGATGDLAYKKIFPALQAMVKRGHLDVPVIGVAKAGWNLDQFRARARDSLEQARRRRRGGVRQAHVAAALRRRRLRRRRPRSPSCASQLGSARSTGALPRDPAGAVRHGRRAARAGATARAGARVIVEKPFGRDLASARKLNAILLAHLRRGAHLPHRPLPRQAAGAQHAVLPLRQRVPRADLEPQVRGERADHDGGELRRAGPRQVLRRDRHHARRRPEPPVPGAVQPGDGAAGAHRQRVDARREGQGAEGDPSAARRTTSCAASSAATCRSRAWRPTRRSRRSPRCGSRRFLALAGRAVLHPRRQEPAGDLHRGDGRACSRPPTVFPTCTAPPNHFRFRIEPGGRRSRSAPR